MKKLLSILALSLFFTAGASAQELTPVTIHLKNGLTFSGDLVSDNGNTLVIKNEHDDVFEYRFEEVSIVDGKDYTWEDSVKTLRRAKYKYGKHRGYRSFLEASYGYNEFEDYSFACDRHSIGYIGGYNAGSCFFIGLGMGVAITDMCCAHSIDMPVYLHLRSALIPGTRVSPFIAVNIGYNISFSGTECINSAPITHTYDYNTFYVEPTLGFEIRGKKKGGLALGLTFPMLPLNHCECGESRGLMGLGGKIAISF